VAVGARAAAVDESGEDRLDNRRTIILAPHLAVDDDTPPVVVAPAAPVGVLSRASRTRASEAKSSGMVKMKTAASDEFGMVNKMKSDVKVIERECGDCEISVQEEEGAVTVRIVAKDDEMLNRIRVLVSKAAEKRERECQAWSSIDSDIISNAYDVFEKEDITDLLENELFDAMGREDDF
jgi:hypothetical protein